MYIKLGQTAINRVASVDDFMIISEVLDSDLSFEFPALVRTVDELDVWFGKNLKERDFLIELLQSGITLYLYKPISTSSWGIDTIDYDSYTSVTFLGMDTISEYYIQYFNEFKHQGNDVVYKTKGVGPRNTIIDKYVYWNGTNFVDASAEKVSKSKHWYVGNVEPTINTLQMGTIKLHNNIKINVNTAVKREGETKAVQTELYVWYDDQLVETSLLPQNIQNYSTSLNNRSTLLLVNKNLGSNIEYYYPEYRIDESNLILEHPEWLENSVFSNEELDQKRMDDGLQTGFLNLKLDLNIGDYVMLPKGNTGRHICISNGLPSNTALVYDAIITDDLGDRLVEFLGENNYFTPDSIQIATGTGTRFVAEIKSLYYSENENEIIAVPVQEFSNSLNTIFEVDNYNNQVLLSQSISPESKAIEFWSKTIGGYDEIEAEEGLDITVTIEALEEENLYRVSLQRYDYLEVFEGYTIGSIYTESLDNKISRDSRLVYCNLLSNELPIGTWKLKGGVKEEKTPEMWQKALNELCNERAETVCPDFFLVPDIKKYIFNEKNNNFISYVASQGDPSYLPIYQTFLDLARTYSCQFLFQNSYYPIDRTISYVKTKITNIYVKEGDDWVLFEQTTEHTQPSIPHIPNVIYQIEARTEIYGVYKVNGEDSEPRLEDTLVDYEYCATDQDGNVMLEDIKKAIAQKLYECEGNECIYNYADDLQNNLVYFYRDMMVAGQIRPGYYAFLYGLLTNNYSISSKVLIYKEPDENPYTEDTLEELLIKKKSNYLVSNNQEYYYKRYLSGKKYTDTIWMKFTAGKIKREMVKNQGLYLGTRFTGQMERDIENILNRITATFSIVGKITLTKLVKNEKQSSLDIYVSAAVNDLISNNIFLNVTINYNNQTNN